MKTTWLAIALAASMLAACSDQKETTPAPSTSQFGAEGTQTAPGQASEAAGNKASENTTDSASTQRQLDPVPEENKPAGTTDGSAK